MPEIEIKLRVADLPALLANLDQLGWRSQGRKHERNVLYDTPDQDLRRRDKLLRIRMTDGKSIVTAKGPSERNRRHKVREEHETEAADGAELGRVFELIGLEPAWVYEKHRTKFTREGAPGEIEVDETPIGNIVELEGSPDWIDQTAAELGFAEDEYVTESYRELFLSWKKRTGSDRRDMVFDE